MKKIVYFLFALIFMLILYPSSSYSSNGFQLREDVITGDLYYTVTARAWTGGVRYRISGFLVHEKISTGLAPKDVPSNRYWEIPMEQVECFSEEDASDGTILTSCRIPTESVRYALILGGMDHIEMGETFYVSAFFQMSDTSGNFTDSTNYYAYWDIVNAPKNKYGISWTQATQEYLRTFFNHAATFRASSEIFMVEIEQGTHWSHENPDVNVLRPIFKIPPPPEHQAHDGNWKTRGVNVDLQPYISEEIIKDGTTYVWNNRVAAVSRVLQYYVTSEGVPPLDTVYTQHYYILTYEVAEDEGDKPDNPGGPPGTPGNPPPTSGGGPQAPSVSDSIQNDPSTMDPVATGVLRADNRGSEMFNVANGIPTGESLYGNVRAKDYLYEFKFDKWTGKAVWNVKVSKTYTLSWYVTQIVGYDPCTPIETGCVGGGPIYDDVERTATETVTRTYQVERPYSYWAIDNISVYGIRNTILNNYALPAGTTTITPTGYNMPTASINKLGSWRDHLEFTPPEDVTLPSSHLGGPGYSSRPSIPAEDWTSHAEAAVGKISVRNDKVVVNGQTVMSDSLTVENGPRPSSMPSQDQIGENVLYRSGMMVTHDKLNSKDNPTTGTITYQPVASTPTASDRQFNVNELNTVTVWTPTVNYSEIPDINRPFDQSVNQDMSRVSLVLGRDFVINFNESGQHHNYLGYGNRNYAKYIQEKRVRFPFDVFVGNTFYPENTWIDFPVGQASMTFTLPTWVLEGNYTVRTESWTKNSPNRSSGQYDFNGTISNYGAVRTFDVKVMGRVYGLTVYDIGDLRYETVFRQAKGSLIPSGFRYYSGRRDKDGIQTAYYDDAVRLLPVRPGSHPETVATTPHNGYPFLFYFNTIGDYWRAGAGVNIEPIFYFVPKNGNAEPIEVDLYYDTTGAKLVKVGSDLDKQLFSRVIKMDDPLRSISPTFLRDMMEFEWNHLVDPSYKSGRTKDWYVNQFIGRKVNIGEGYKNILLDYKARTLIGPVNSSIPVDGDTQARSIQRWFAEYNLPIAPYILPAGTNLEELVRTKYGGRITGKEDEFLRNGYIIVNFKIETYRHGNPDSSILAYDASPYGGANMWKIEDQLLSSTSYLGANFDYNYGDVIMFESDFSVRDDFRGGGR